MKIQFKRYWNIWNNHLDSMFLGKNNDTVSCWNGEIMTICMAARKKTGIHNPRDMLLLLLTIGIFFRSSNDQYGFVYLYFEYTYYHCLLPLVFHYHRYEYNFPVHHNYQYTNRVISMFNLMLIITVFVYQLYVWYLSNDFLHHHEVT